MNDLIIAAIPFSFFVVFFAVWLHQLGQQNAALRAAKQARLAEATASQESESAAVQVPA